MKHIKKLGNADFIENKMSYALYGKFSENIVICTILICHCETSIQEFYRSNLYLQIIIYKEIASFVTARRNPRKNTLFFFSYEYTLLYRIHYFYISISKKFHS